MEQPSARVDAVLARDAPVCIVFRRGPSDWVSVIRWDLESDELAYGDWFRGRLYTRRCDLSPAGDRLVYFAANFGSTRQPGFAYGYSWTAVSEPPSLTPLVYWPKDDCWAGGGLFAGNAELDLNERAGVAVPELPAGLQVRFDASARGEDEPLYGRRLERDGFALIQPLVGYWSSDFVTTQPEIRRKIAASGAMLELTRARQDFTDLHRYAYTHPAGAKADLQDLEWADFDQNGRVIGASHGRLVASATTATLEFGVIADLNQSTPPT
jgi:hypothetical protein